MKKITNEIRWDGTVVDINGNESMIECHGIDGNGDLEEFEYIIVKPVHTSTAMYESRLGVVMVGIPPELLDEYGNLYDDNGELGYGWRHGFGYSVDASDIYATVTFANGYRLQFKEELDELNGDPDQILGASYKAVPETDLYELEAYNGGHKLSDIKGNEYIFDGDGLITSMADVHGNETTFAYTGGKLTGVTNRSGTLTMGYTGDRITSVSDGTGRSVTIAYTGDDLTSVTNADGDTIGYTYESACEAINI